MSEKLHHHGAEQRHPSHEVGEHHKQQLEKESREKAQAARHEHREALGNIKLKIEQEAVSGAETAAREDILNPDKSQQIILTKDVRKAALKESLSQIRRHLNKTERPFSKLLHNQAVDRLSEFGGKTIARPSGLFAGGLTAFIGTLILIYLTRHYGYTYRYGTYILLFALGFTVGLIVELVFGFVLRRRKSQ